MQARPHSIRARFDDELSCSGPDAVEVWTAPARGLTSSEPPTAHNRGTTESHARVLVAAFIIIPWARKIEAMGREVKEGEVREGCWARGGGTRAAFDVFERPGRGTR